MKPGQPLNPYAPPVAEVNLPSPDAAAAEAADLATHGQRFGAAMIDGVIAWAAIAPIFVGSSFAELAAVSQRANSRPFAIFTEMGSWGAVAGLLTLVLLLVQWALLARRGQTIGKMLAGVRVVATDGGRAGFGRIVLLRTFLPWVVSQAIAFSQLLMLPLLIDVLLIFRGDRRCGHDLVAGTKVVRATQR